MNIQDWFSDMIPVRRKSASDWIVPAAVGLGVGIAAGIGIGLLYAPSTGEEARMRLREQASRVKDRAAELASRAKREASTAGAPEREPFSLGHS